MQSSFNYLGGEKEIFLEILPPCLLLRAVVLEPFLPYFVVCSSQEFLGYASLTLKTFSCQRGLVAGKEQQTC